MLVMKIVLDPEIFQLQKYGGISRYYTELFSILKPTNTVIIPFYKTDNIYYNKSPLVNLRQKIYLYYLRILSKLKKRNFENSSFRNDKYLKQTLSHQQYDLFIPTYYNPYFIEKIGSKPYVLTVYDMIHELFPEYFAGDTLKVVENKKYLMERATKIIAVSYNTKKDIIKIYPHIDSCKIEVVYHGCSINISNSIKNELPENYILYIGKREGYKNFIFLVESIKDLLLIESNLFLICAGGGEFSSAEKLLQKNLGLEKKVIQMDFAEEELSCFYKQAKCFVFPSLYEGFGIPILESMKCGCPVVLARHSSFPEVAEDAGIYFELHNHKDLSDKICLLLENYNLRREYSLKCVEQVRKFTWEKAANECMSIYKSACLTE